MSMGSMNSDKVTVIPAKSPDQNKPIRVAAYCRVSTEHEEQDSSLGAQKQYYRHKILSTPNWELAGVYAERVSGTDFKKRTIFNKLIRDGKVGKFDLLLTKSISRFGRNVSPLLASLHELTINGVRVVFEMERLDNTDWRMKQIIAAYAAVAQQESLDKSESIKWGIQRNFENGKAHLNHIRFLGYTKNENGQLVVVPEEAEIVRRIFCMYSEGNGCRKIKKHWELNGIKTISGKDIWSTSTIDRILSNEKYVGRLIQQKTYVDDSLSHMQKKNEGQLPQ